MVSCNLQEKVTKNNHALNNLPDIKDYDTTGKSNGDLPDDVVTVSHKNVTLKSHGLVYESVPYEKLKIVEVKNTKVIKQSNNFSEGRIVYKIPNIMKIRSTYKVFVRISKSKSTVSIYDSLSGEVMTSKIPVSETMECKLVDVSPNDKKHFYIVDANSAIQIIENGDTYTEWSWDVTPIHIGNSKLKIVVSVIKNDNKKDIVYEDTVEIERDLKEQIIFFWEEYWKWLITTFIIPFVVWWWKNRKKKNNNQEKTEEDGKGETV